MHGQADYGGGSDSDDSDDSDQEDDVAVAPRLYELRISPLYKVPYMIEHMFLWCNHDHLLYMGYCTF